MTDEQVENIIRDEIKRRDIVFQDMIGLPGYGVCPEQKDRSLHNNQASRLNRFTAVMGSERMKELLCVGEWNPYNDSPPLKVSFNELFRFWWAKCIDQHLFLDEILDDIYDYFTDQMRPVEKEVEEQMEMSLDFDQLPLFTMDLERAA